MATFDNLLNTLPDPNYKKELWGKEDSGGTAGPGFASIKLTNDQKVMVTRTNSQKVIARAAAGQKWKIDITYHPMTREEFEPVHSFLLRLQGPLTPFYVSLPQYRISQNTDWDTDYVTKTFVDNGDAKNAYTFERTLGGTAGTDNIVLNVEKDSSYNGTAYSNASDTKEKIPRPGDMITVANHTKAYLITLVETLGFHQSGETIVPTSNSHIKLRVSPPFAKTVGTSDAITFSNPLIKVIQPKPLGGYSLNTENLYSFNLKLEEHL